MIPASQVDFSNLDTEGVQVPGSYHYIRIFPKIDTGWKIKRWFQIDLERLKEWYADLERDYGDWKFIQGEHDYMWSTNPNDPTGTKGHRLMPDTAWYNLCWNPVDRKGVVPPERSNTKPEYREVEDNNDLNPRECFKGYGLEICEEIQKQVRIKKVVISILTTGTLLIEHQDAPDKFRFHISLYNNKDAHWIIDGEKIDIPDDGWVYLVNTSLPHTVWNDGDAPRVNLYGKVFTEDIIKLGL